MAISNVFAAGPSATSWPRLLWTSWLAHWPRWLGAVGAIWLAVSLLLLSPDGWLERVTRSKARVTQLNQQISQLEKASGQPNPSALYTKVTYLEGRRYGVWLGTWLQAGLALGLPYALLLTAIGYWLYWYFARKTVFTSTWSGQFSFWLAVLVLWGLWKGSIIAGAQISPATARAGVDQLLPTLTVGYWLSQCLLMHIVTLRREDRALAQNAREAELAALTAQINPPFIFHALRHLQAAAQAEQLPRAEQSLAQLAGIMQYVLEESRKQLTDVSRETEFIRDYLRLQQLRLPPRDTIQISTDVTWDGRPAPIVPLLLNPLIENAFKYGISMQQACFVTIQLHVINSTLTFVAENSVLPRTDLEKGTGLGLANVRKRLRLAYPDHHKLVVVALPDRYRVDLKIKLV